MFEKGQLKSPSYFGITQFYFPAWRRQTMNPYLHVAPDSLHSTRNGSEMNNAVFTLTTSHLAPPAAARAFSAASRIRDDSWPSASASTSCGFFVLVHGMKPIAAALTSGSGSC